jgi:hypothetical protein
MVQTTPVVPDDGGIDFLCDYVFIYFSVQNKKYAASRIPRRRVRGCVRHKFEMRWPHCGTKQKSLLPIQ